MKRRALSIRAAHDLRAPISAILMWEQVAQRSDDPELRARALDEIRQAALAQAKLIDKLSSR